MTDFVDVRHQDGSNVVSVPVRSLPTWEARGFVRVDTTGQPLLTPTEESEAPDAEQLEGGATAAVDSSVLGELPPGSGEEMPDPKTSDETSSGDSGTAAGSADSTSSDSDNKPAGGGRRNR